MFVSPTRVRRYKGIPFMASQHESGVRIRSVRGVAKGALDKEVKYDDFVEMMRHSQQEWG